MNENFDTWHSLIMNCLNKHAPLKSKRVKHKRLPVWFTPEITQMQKLRDKSKLLKQWRDYKRYRNKTKQLIRSAKRKYFSESVKHSKDSSSLWKHLRYVSQNKTASSNALPDELIINDETVTNAERVAAKINKYFTSIAEILNVQPGDLPPSEIEKKNRNFTYTRIPEQTYFHIPPVTCEQVTSFINKLDPSKAIGIDGFGPRILKMACHILSPTVTMLINKSLKLGIFPDQLKNAKVFPILKGAANYRPVSILLTVSKFFEKHINLHLMGYLNKYRLLHEGQSGIRQKHSCQTALIKLIDHWMECIDKGDLVGTLLVDFRKAFDLVNHSILLEKKLKLYKFSHSVTRWFESYLYSRQQTIACNNSLSNFAQVRTSVPQGSILGPILFLIFINDLPLSLINCKSDLYADDATFHTHHEDLLVIENKLQTVFDNTKTWGKDHKMEIHDIKTSCMAVRSRKRMSEPHNIEIKSGDISIRNVSCQKLLGVYIDENFVMVYPY